MMFFHHRKLLVSDKNIRVLLVKELLSTCSCYLYCPPHCNNGSEVDELIPPPPPSHKNSMPVILVFMLCVLGAVFVFLCYLTIRRRHEMNLRHSVRISASANGTHDGFLDENHAPRADHPIWYIRTVGLEQSVIDSIAVFKYNKGDGLIEGTDCSVCLSEFEDDESLRLLPKCSHAFHITCIDTWLRSHKNCPLCRAPVVDDFRVNTSTDVPQMMNTAQSVLDNSGPREDGRLDNEQESVAVGEGMTSELRIGVENTGPLSHEEGKDLEQLRKNCKNFAAGKDRVRVLSDLADHRVRIGEEIQPVRRSLSMDLPSASVIYAAVAKIHPVIDEGSSSVQDLEVKKQNLEIVAAKQGGKSSSIHRSRKSFSFGRSLQSVPMRMKRSFSSSGKISIHRHGRSQELVRSF